MASPYVSARIGNNSDYPYEVCVGCMVRMFADREEAFSFAVMENRECIKEDEEKLRRKILDLQIFEGFDIVSGYEETETVAHAGAAELL